jgi:hypothetical protein
MNYTVETASGGIMYIPSFIKISLGFQKSGWGDWIHAHRQHGDSISLVLFFKIREVG